MHAEIRLHFLLKGGNLAKTRVSQNKEKIFESNVLLIIDIKPSDPSSPGLQLILLISCKRAVATSDPPAKKAKQATCDVVL